MFINGSIKALIHVQFFQIICGIDLFIDLLKGDLKVV